MGRVAKPIFFIISIGLSTMSLRHFMESQYGDYLTGFALAVGAFMCLVFAAVIESITVGGIKTVSRGITFGDFDSGFVLGSSLFLLLFFGTINVVTNYTSVSYIGDNFIPEAEVPVGVDSLSSVVEAKRLRVDEGYAKEASRIEAEHQHMEDGYRRAMEAQLAAVDAKIAVLRRREQKENTSFATLIGQLEEDKARRELRANEKIAEVREAQSAALAELRAKTDRARTEAGKGEQVHISAMLQSYEDDKSDKSRLKGAIWALLYLVLIGCQVGVAAFQFHEDAYCASRGIELEPTVAEETISQIGNLFIYLAREGVLRVVVLFALLFRWLFKLVDWAVDKMDDGELNGSSTVLDSFDRILKQMGYRPPIGRQASSRGSTPPATAEDEQPSEREQTEASANF